jgi:hypothetical protein
MPTLTGLITADGALVNVLIGVSEARRQTLLRVGFPVPAPSAVRAVLDTGSFITLADAPAIAVLGVTRFRRQKYFTSATGTTPHIRDVYKLSVTLLDDGGAPLAYWPSVDVLPAVFLPTDAVHGVIGRDLLATAVLHFDGKGGAFTLTV